MIKEGKGIRPRRLTDLSPDDGFFNIGCGLVIPGEEADGIIGVDGRDEELREEVLDGGIRRYCEFCRVGFRTCK